VVSQGKKNGRTSCFTISSSSARSEYCCFRDLNSWKAAQRGERRRKKGEGRREKGELNLNQSHKRGVRFPSLPLVEAALSWENLTS